jgi:DNA-binding MarR family transcriptional regulator
MRVLLLLWRQRPTWLTAVEITTMLSSTKLHVHRALKRFKELNYVDRRPATPEERADRSHFDHFHLHMYRLAEEFVPD